VNIHYRKAAMCLDQGGVIAYPTEAVWGLGCDPWDVHAVARLLELKQRDPAKGLIVIAGTLQQVEPWLANLSAAQQATLKASWPGPRTWLVPDVRIAPPWVRGEHASIALRVSDHPVVQGVCAAFGGPMVSTSANPAGKAPARNALEVRRYFGAALDTIVPGETGGLDRPTEIRDLLTGEIARHG
jgi:L-threonylcarbamoyladenylate synthase